MIGYALSGGVKITDLACSNCCCYCGQLAWCAVAKLGNSFDLLYVRVGDLGEGLGVIESGREDK